MVQSYQTVGPIIAPIVVANNFVIIAGDDSHIYALDRAFGNQQRSVNIGQKMAFGPVAQDGVIYFVDQSGFSYALNFELAQIWRSTINGTPLTPLYLAGNRLFIGTREADGAVRILSIDRSLDKNGTVFPERYNGTELFPAMAIGHQLIYIGDPSLRAIDINKLNVVWQQDSIGRLSAPPVYVNNGLAALAELYVADDQNRLHLVDANTGKILWTVGAGSQITGLAVGAETVCATGANFPDGVVPTEWQPTMAS
ncbi:MAG: PQQ-binding-like beta-propeller repeat protein [Caldilineaceae bacterium]